jgi:hypothetical protein
MSWMAAATALSVVQGAAGLGKAYQQYGAFKDQGNYARRLGGLKARYLEEAAGQKLAIGQRGAIEARRQIAEFGQGAYVARQGAGRTVTPYRHRAIFEREAGIAAGNIKYTSASQARALRHDAMLARMQGEADEALADQRALAAAWGGFESVVGAGSDIAGRYAGGVPPSETESFSELSARRGYGTTPRKAKYPSLATKYAPVKGSGMHPTLRYG